MTPGIFNKGYVSAIQMMDAREIMPEIVDVANDKQFIDITRLMGRTKETTVPIYYNHVNEDVNQVGIVASVTSGSGTVTVVAVLTSGSSGSWVKSQLIKVNGKNALITNVSTNSGTGVDTLTFSSVNANVLTVAAAAKITKVGAAVGEGANPATGTRYKTTLYSNKIQAIEHYAPGLTDIQAMSKTEIKGSGIWGYQRDQDITAMKKDISGTLIGGQGSVTLFADASPVLVDSDGKPVQTTSGLDEQVVTYGNTRNLTTTGVVVLADITAREDALIAKKSPKSFMVVGSTAAMRPYSTYFKALGSGGVNSVRMNIDGRSIDLVVDNYRSVGGFSYDHAQIDTFDDPTVYPSAATNIGGSLYYIPKDSVNLVNGGTQKRFLIRYMKNEDSTNHAPQGKNVSWEDLICERSWGGKTGTDGTNTLFTKWTTYQGLELLGLPHFFKEVVIF